LPLFLKWGETMPFPPNYRIDKSNRARSKAQKALEKQAKRDEKSAKRKQERQDAPDEDGREQDKAEQT
jgi:hypothetical protein